MPEPFASSRQHLYAELRRLDLLIQREVWRWRQMNSPDPQAGDEFRGLYVSEAEVDAILRGIYPGSELVLDQAAGQDAELAFSAAIQRATAEIGPVETGSGIFPFDLAGSQIDAQHRTGESNVHDGSPSILRRVLLSWSRR